MNTPIKEHLLRRTLTIQVFAPDHPDRSNTPIFEHTRSLLIKNNPDAKCEINNEHCDHDHPLELHHEIEWCDSNGLDWEKVKVDYPDFPWESFDPSHPETFIDSKYNARHILCKKHHIGADHGIHYLPSTDWKFQKYKRSDFVFSPDENDIK